MGARGKALEKAKGPPGRSATGHPHAPCSAKTAPVAGAPPPAPATVLPKGLMRPESAASLATPRRQSCWSTFGSAPRCRAGNSPRCTERPERYAELVRAFRHRRRITMPIGGMPDHGLEIVAHSLKLQRSHLLPIGASPEISWSSTDRHRRRLRHALLRHRQDRRRSARRAGRRHARHPWHAPAAPAIPLPLPRRSRVPPAQRRDRSCSTASCSTARSWTGSAAIRPCGHRCSTSWLGECRHTPALLGELVVQADRASVAQELGGDPTRAMAAPKHALPAQAARRAALPAQGTG